LNIQGSWLGQSPLVEDNRGYFREWFKLQEVKDETGYCFNTEQANISKSSKGTIRGIHYSLASEGQAKWITCVSGAIRDYVIDIRPQSNTFGEWVEVLLTSDSGLSVLIGEGLGHAFVSLEEGTTVAYLLSSPYQAKEEFGINPFDPEIGIEWGENQSDFKISEKDRLAPSLQEMREQGKLPNY
jgi:dTDP-4-dehydrorhamnose 3,5-epimerase